MSEIKKARNYFDEKTFQEKVKEYQDTAVFRDGTLVIKNEKLERELMIEVNKIINAIIMVYRYYIFEDYDDLKQHAALACFNNFMKFTPKKGTAFNYFSIIAKISLLNYTDRRKKHRNHNNIEEQIHLHSNDITNYNMVFDNLEDTLFKIIDENYVGRIREKYSSIASLILDYLRKTKKFVSKSDLYSWCRAYGVKNVEVRSFINEMKRYNNQIFEGV